MSNENNPNYLVLTEGFIGESIDALKTMRSITPLWEGWKELSMDKDMSFSEIYTIATKWCKHHNVPFSQRNIVREKGPYIRGIKVSLNIKTDREHQKIAADYLRFKEEMVNLIGSSARYAQ